MIKLLVPNVPPLERITPYLARAHERRWYTNFGPLVEELEARLSKMLDCHVATTATCTDALELAFELYREMGLETIDLSPLTFPATALAAKRVGLYVRLKDVDPETWSNGTVAAFGLPGWRGPVIDAAAAIGEQNVGEEAVYCFSLHATKPLAGIEGGFIATKSAAEAEDFRRRTNFGFLSPTRTAKYKLGYAVTRGIGTNAKLSEYHAAVALASLDAWDETREKFLKLWDWYEPRLPADVVLQRRERGVYPILAVKLPKGVSPRLVAVKMLESYGVETRRWYVPPLYRQELFADDPRSFPVTEELVNSLLGLPWHVHLSEEDVDRVCSALVAAIEETAS